jgi:lysozyme
MIFPARILGASALAAFLCAGGLAAHARMSDTDRHDGVARAHTMPVQGIDVSAWQGDIDWRKARAAGIAFAYIKATEGGDHVDPNFLDNWYAAKEAGVARGAYHFVYWCRSAEEQALWFLLNVPDDADALPPVLDVEWNSQSKTCPKRIDREQALQKIQVLLAAMQSHTGKRPIIYTDPVFFREVLAGASIDYPLWLRSVAAEPEEVYGERPYVLWQFTTTGRVPGIDGNVDRNVFNGAPAEWDRVLQSLYAGR